MNVEIENKYIIQKKIGEGMYGKIFSAKNKYTDEIVAIKIDGSILLKNEARIYQILSNQNGISKLRSYGQVADYNYIVIDMMGSSLEGCREKCINKIFTLKTTICIGLQLIRRIEILHNNNILHRDVKPENFLMGGNIANKNILYIIDFGLSKLYKINGKHVDCQIGRDPIGTLDFVSINVHEGNTPSRRDDMESIGYILLYLLGGSLPWMTDTNINENAEEPIERKIYNIKKNTNLWVRYQCIPGEFITFIQYCRSLGYSDTPNYTYLEQLLTNLFKMNRFSIENPFCWNDT